MRGIRLNTYRDSIERAKVQTELRRAFQGRDHTLRPGPETHYSASRDGERQAPRTRLGTFANGERELPRAFVLTYCARGAKPHRQETQRAQIFYRACELTKLLGDRINRRVPIFSGSQFHLVACDGCS